MPAETLDQRMDLALAALGGEGAHAPTLDERMDRALDAVAPGRIEALGRGAIQGATMGFGDELAGAAKAFLSPQAIFGKDKRSDLYREGRDENRAGNDAAQKAHGGYYLGGQVAGGLATAVIPGGAPATLGRALATGAGYGAVAGLGDSKADLTEGDVGGAAKDTLLGAGAGAVAGGVGYGVVKGAGAVKNWLFPKARIAAKAAADSASDAVESSTKTVGEYTDASRAIENEVTQDTGRRMQLSPGQATGSKEVLAAERTASQTPGKIDDMRRLQTERLDVAADYLENIVKHVSADTERLSSLEVGDQVAKAITKQVESLKAARSAAARPLYDKAEKLLGNKQIVPIDEVTSFISTELERSVGPFQESAAPLKQTLDALTQSSKRGLANIKTVRALAEKWGQQSEGTGELLKDLPIAQRKFIAGKMAELLNRAIDSAAESGQRTEAGIVALREAQGTWAQHSQGIDDVATDAVKRILGVEPQKADDIPRLVMSMSPNQIKGVVNILEKSDPVAAKQLAGGVLLEAFRGAGAAARAGAFGSEPTARLSAAKVIAALNDKNNAQKIRAVLGNNPTAVNKLNTTVELMRRLGSGPGIEGSDTFAKMAQFVNGLARRAGEAGLGSKTAATIKEVAGIIPAMSEEQASLLFTSGIDEFHKLAEGALRGQSQGVLRRTTIRGLAQAAAKLGVLLRESVPAARQADAADSENAEAFNIDPTNLQGAHTQ